MSLQKRRPIVHAAAVAVLAAAAASPAHAQAVGGNVSGFIQNIVDFLQQDVIRGLAILAVIATGVAWMFGHLDLRKAGAVVVAIIVVFGAAPIVDMITGGG